MRQFSFAGLSKAVAHATVTATVTATVLMVLFAGTAHAKLKEGQDFAPLKTSAFPGAPSVSSAMFKGKLVIVDFWASWCEPCKVELPALNSLYKKYRSKGLVVIGVNVDDDVKDAKAFLKEHPVTFSLVHDKGQKNSNALGIEKMPTSFILSNGKVVKIHEAFRSGDEKKIEAEILKYLK